MPASSLWGAGLLHSGDESVHRGILSFKELLQIEFVLGGHCLHNLLVIVETFHSFVKQTVKHSLFCRDACVALFEAMPCT